jgi:ADP-ribosyl-[dinitrogen reductase] hydrolase
MSQAKQNGKEYIDAEILSRAQGCLLGQLAGDALGSLVEFRSPEDIRRQYPGGVRKLAEGGTYNTIAGQPTDDSEMALMLARMLVDHGTYKAEQARKAYIYWLNTGPFDLGITVATGLRGQPNYDSQANGAMMRISTLGIFGANHDLAQVADWAWLDAAITHPHPVCQQANALYTMAIAHAISTGTRPQDLYQQILVWADDMKVDAPLLGAITGAATAPPDDYVHHQGWVLIAFRNAAICGALLGSAYGRDAIPDQWVKCLLNCRPAAGLPHARHPRPKCFWPVDALELAERLVSPRRHEG